MSSLCVAASNLADEWIRKPSVRKMCCMAVDGFHERVSHFLAPLISNDAHGCNKLNVLISVRLSLL